MAYYNKNTSNKTRILSNHSKCRLRQSKDASEYQDVIVTDFKIDEKTEEWSVRSMFVYLV